MKTYLIIPFFLLCNSFVYGQSPNWLWAKQASGISTEEGTSVAVDVNGNVLVTGTYNNTNTGSYSINIDTVTLNGTGGIDIFIAKYNSAGNLIWAKTVGGAGDDKSMAIKTDINGNIYLTGYYSSTITIDTINLTTNAGFDLFVCKFNALGQVQWATSAGGSSADYANAVDVDSIGNSYVTGYFKSANIAFGSTILSNPNSIIGGSQYFVAKFNQAGHHVWAKTIGTGTGVGNGISVSTNNSVFVTGNFAGTVTFDTLSLTSAGSKDIFVTHYDSSGTVLWANKVGGNLEDNANGIVSDANGNCYFTGFFKSINMTVGATLINNTGSPDGDVLLVKYDVSGNVVWAKKANGYSNDAGLAIGLDAIGNVYITGYYNGSLLIFGSIPINSNGVTTNVGDLFIVKYDTMGTALWAKNLLASMGAWGKAIAVDPLGYCYVTGFYEDPTIVFSAITLSNTSITGVRDQFIAKLDTGSSSVVNIHNLVAMQSLTIQPNPSNGQFQLYTSNSENCTIEIYNALGAVVYHSIINSKLSTIDISNQAKGIYMLRVLKNNSILGTQKIVLE